MCPVLAESSQKVPYVAPDALDKHGKALYGVPGPGRYEPATSFSGHADAGRQVFQAAPAFTAAARLLAPHKLHLAHQFDCLVPRWTSPGPAAYAAAPAVRVPLLPPVSPCGCHGDGLSTTREKPYAAQRSASPFGWSEREADARTYAVSGALPGRLGDCSPGPAYDVRGLRARPGPAGAAAVIGGGTAQRLPPVRSESPHGPYGMHTDRVALYGLGITEILHALVHKQGAPDTIGEAASPVFPHGPQAMFAPRGPYSLSAARDRHGEGLKVYNGPGLDLPGAHLEDKASQPGPGHYGAPTSAVQARAPNDPAFSFALGDRGLHSEPAWAAPREPGAVADDGAAAPSSLQPHPATVFAPPQHRTPWQAAGASGLPGTGVKWQCRLEMALSGGPWVMLRAGGPGPAAYDVRGRFAAGAPHADFGLASRALTLQDVASACHKVGIPGPGAYHAAESASVQAPSAPAYPFGLRPHLSQKTFGHNTPGPGAYSDSAGVHWRFHPGIKIVRDRTRRTAYVPRCDSPGPVYLPCTPRRAARGVCVNMGRRGAAARALNAHAARDSWFPGAAGCREALLGQDSPGPGYNVGGQAARGCGALGQRRCSSALGTFPRATRRLADAPAKRGQPPKPLSRVWEEAPAGGALPGRARGAPPKPGAPSVVSRFHNAGAFSFGTSQRSQILNIRF